VVSNQEQREGCPMPLSECVQEPMQAVVRMRKYNIRQPKWQVCHHLFLVELKPVRGSQSSIVANQS
jgi:hypothetical protein